MGDLGEFGRCTLRQDMTLDDYLRTIAAVENRRNALTAGAFGLCCYAKKTELVRLSTGVVESSPVLIHRSCE